MPLVLRSSFSLLDASGSDAEGSVVFIEGIDQRSFEKEKKRKRTN